MRKVNFIFVWILFITFLSGKAHVTTHFTECKSSFKEQKKESVVAQKISEDNSEEGSAQKRKRRARGVEVTIPQISEVSFVKVLVYKVFKPVYTESIYVSFLHCVHLKRGPPLI